MISRLLCFKKRKLPKEVQLESGSEEVANSEHTLPHQTSWEGVPPMEHEPFPTQDEVGIER